MTPTEMRKVLMDFVPKVYDMDDLLYYYPFSYSQEKIDRAKKFIQGDMHALMMEANELVDSDPKDSKTISAVKKLAAMIYKEKGFPDAVKADFDEASIYRDRYGNTQEANAAAKEIHNLSDKDFVRL